jgi:hypothetical protein
MVGIAGHPSRLPRKIQRRLERCEQPIGGRLPLPFFFPRIHARGCPQLPAFAPLGPHRAPSANDGRQPCRDVRGCQLDHLAGSDRLLDGVALLPLLRERHDLSTTPERGEVGPTLSLNRPRSYPLLSPSVREYRLAAAKRARGRVGRLAHAPCPQSHAPLVTVKLLIAPESARLRVPERESGWLPSLLRWPDDMRGG